ncbi:MAG: HD domain-containing phosphohydrolase [Candidatus Sumerlaeaceae bacterium]
MTAFEESNSPLLGKLGLARADLALLALDAACAGVWCWELETGQMWGDERVAAFLGLGKGEVNGEATAFFSLVHPAERKALRAKQHEALSRPGVHEAHFRLRTKDGHLRYFCVRAHGVAKETIRPALLVGVIWDETLTQRREREHHAVVTISEALRLVSGGREVIERAFEEIREVLDTPHALIAVQTEECEAVVVQQACGRWTSLVDKDASSDEGIIGAVMRSKKVYVSDNAASDPRCLRPEMLQGLDGFMAVPIMAGDKLMGVLALGRPQPYDPNDVAIAAALSDVLGIALARIRHEKDLARRMRELTILHEMDLAIVNTLDLRQALEDMLARVIGYLGMDAAAVHLINKAQNVVECRAARGFRTVHIWHARPRPGEGLLGSIATSLSPIFLNGAQVIASRCKRHKMLEEEGFVAYAGFPLVAKQEVVGVLELFNRTLLRFTQQWRHFAQVVAGQVAVCLTNAELYTDIQKMHAELMAAYEATIEGWARAVELRDSFTERHCLRVTELAVALACFVGYTSDAIVILRRGALLHDIGKLGVPDAILHKPGPLTEEEWAVMRQHPRLAIEMLRPIKFLEPSLDIPAYHHERWDGKGYPFGLAGEDIPHSARLFSVVDVYDALTSERPYRKAWSVKDALEYIAMQAGTQFDPKAAQAFHALMGNGAYRG